jgi:hypothetical protein
VRLSGDDQQLAAIGWNSAAGTISSVTDTAGNVYTLAAPLTRGGGNLSQAIYYAKNIVAAPAGNATNGFTTRVLTQPNFDIAADRVVNAVGTYAATAPLTGGGYLAHAVGSVQGRDPVNGTRAILTQPPPPP